jgi:transketolase
MDDLQNKCINTLRFLSVDAIQKANSGHPGLPMGAAAMAFTIWTRHLKHDPHDPHWIDRDRFILSGGHGSMLLYSLLHLTGYNVSMEQIKEFRQWGSITPGHPELGLTPGVEVTTGPLGQGFSNGVGMAIAEAHMAAEFNRPGYEIVNHHVYAIVTDGDLMEGVSSEAASLAGHLRLGKIIYFYDDNHISIDGSTDLAFTEDRISRFEAYGWNVINITDGNDVEAIDNAIETAKLDPRPSLIVCRTHIGYGLPTRQDTAKAHGEPPGEEELKRAKMNLGWPIEPPFLVPEDVAAFYRRTTRNGEMAREVWDQKFQQFKKNYPDLAKEFTRRIASKLPKDWATDLPEFSADEKGMATRASSGKVINELAGRLPELVGGSADLTPSTITWIQSSSDFQPATPEGRNLHFGVREHGMGAIINGITAHKGLIPFGATFAVFSDYMRGAIRVGALSKLPAIWVLTHDSIGLGEDGPTHQPVEHLAALRAIPNIVMIRPADANETMSAWKVAIERRNGPTILMLSRQACPTLDRKIFSSADNLSKGAYILGDLGEGSPKIILMASGSEVALIVEAGKKLAEKGLGIRLVSFPSWELFEQQDDSYRDNVLPSNIKKRVAVEAAVRLGWDRWIGTEGAFIGMNTFGASAPYKILYEAFGITVDKILKTVEAMLS